MNATRSHLSQNGVERQFYKKRDLSCNRVENELTQAGEVIRIGQTTVTFLLEAKDTNGQLAMFEFTVPADAKVPVPHSHERYDETVYGIQGVITFTVNGIRHDIGPSETFFIPRGAIHGFNNFGRQDTKTLAVVTPALIGPEFFKEVAALVNAGGPLDLEKIKAAYSKYGLKPAPMS
jgi:quercetin dioxygenase-like cupin family protein